MLKKIALKQFHLMVFYGYKKSKTKVETNDEYMIYKLKVMELKLINIVYL